MGYLKHRVTFIFIILAICAGQRAGANIAAQHINGQQVHYSQSATYRSYNNMGSQANNHTQNIPKTRQHKNITDSSSEQERKSSWRSRISSAYNTIDNKRLALKAWIKKCCSNHPFIVLLSIWGTIWGTSYSLDRYNAYIAHLKKLETIQKNAHKQEKLLNDKLAETDCPVCCCQYDSETCFRIRLNHVRINTDVVGCEQVMCINCEQRLLDTDPRCPTCRGWISQKAKK